MNTHRDGVQGWLKGQLPTGEFGWVPAEFLEVSRLVLRACFMPFVP